MSTAGSLQTREVLPVSAAAPYAVETNQLTRRFGRHEAVSGLDLKIPRGCVCGFLGLNGAGKSTTLRMLMGLLSPTSGTARVLGLDPQSEDIALKRRVGYVPDTPTFYEWMTVEETLAFVAHYRKGEWDNALADHLLGAFEVPANQKVGTLSKGQRAKVSLILALAFNPELLLLDEPTLGLDPVARRQFVEGLLAEYMEGERTVIVSSHLIHEIAGIVDYVVIIRDGRLIRSEPAESLLAGIRRIRLSFAEGAPVAPALPGLIRHHASGRELHVVVDAFDEAVHLPAVQAMKPDSVEMDKLSLEEAFVELAGRGEVLR